MRMTNIKSICYQLYVKSWEEKHKTVSSFREYCEYCLENDIPNSSILSYDDYLYEVNGGKYCILPEFLDYEYQDKEYIKELLSSDILYNEYLKDISKKGEKIFNDNVFTTDEGKKLIIEFNEGNKTEKELLDEGHEYFVIIDDLSMAFSNIAVLPKNLIINGDADFSHTRIKNLPEGFRCDGDLDLSYTSLEELPDNLTVNGTLRLIGCKNISKLPNGLIVKGRLLLNESNIKELPNDLVLADDLVIENTNIMDIPDNITTSNTNIICSDLLKRKLKRNKQKTYNEVTLSPTEANVSINELPQKMVVKGEIRCNTPLKRKVTIGMLLEYVKALEHKGFTKENIKKLNICLGDDNSKEFTAISNNQNSIIIS